MRANLVISLINNERIETTYAPRIPFIEVFGNVKYEIDMKTYT